MDFQEFLKESYHCSKCCLKGICECDECMKSDECDCE